MKFENLLKLSSDEILAGSFGIEWESLRAKEDGKLSLTPHPAIFGDKLTNPVITTDFSESQIEIITPTFDTIDEAYDTFSLLADLVNASLPDDEYLWFQSIPCILPYWDRIPIAQYSEDGVDNQKYREDLAKKYGVKKQMISGVHFNFSFSDNFLKKLYSLEKSNATFKEFKNDIYLKIARNYLRYCWLIIYLTGCSIGSHRTFSHDCIHLMDARDDYGSYYSTRGPSFRNASCGYKNLKDLYPSYDSVEDFTGDINRFIADGDLSEAKELYTQIRLKPKNPKDLLNSLNDDGIEYIEIRTLDINPFYKCGLVKKDMAFLHLFLIYMLIKEESDYEFWQKEAKINEENTAERAYDDSMRLLKDGKEVSIGQWASEIVDDMYEMCDALGINEFDTLNMMYERISNPDSTYGKKLLRLIKKRGYINAHIELSKNNKQISVENLKNMDICNDGEFRKYFNVALVGK
ncbi:glutamate--cysteine ligase [Methanobrevibacter sp.]|uniref:glutamate--cysteine ligase n=1 Tax=Methanobrevibacter sp. TaxID=66852 RepID=UPI002E79708E|nr:glutamate--cysteine ligase [Methanobrevibacter sp.]MEE0938658.1 glutamate--cysteine ligase [Methanobrevibacter sp.]